MNAHNDTNGPAPLLTVADACRMLRVSRWTLYRLMNEGSLHSIKIGRSRRLSPLAISRYLESIADTGGET